MENFIEQLLILLAKYFLFFVIVIFISACLLTGEFPPKMSSLLELKKNYYLVTKNISERMKALETAVPGQAQVQTPNTTTPKIATNPSQTDTDLTINLREIRAEQLRIANQLDKISEQNKQILLKIK